MFFFWLVIKEDTFIKGVAKYLGCSSLLMRTKFENRWYITKRMVFNINKKLTFS